MVDVRTMKDFGYGAYASGFTVPPEDMDISRNIAAPLFPPTGLATGSRIKFDEQMDTDVTAGFPPIKGMPPGTKIRFGVQTKPPAVDPPVNGETMEGTEASERNVTIDADVPDFV